MKRTPLLTGLAGLGLALALAGPAAGDDGAGPYRVTPQIVPVTRIVHAEVQADERPVARARITGLIRSLEVDEGDRVQAGDVIARVEDPELSSRIAAAEAEVARAAARDRMAQRDLVRARALFEENTLSAARLDEATRRAADAAGAESAARSEVETLRTRRARGDVLAPAAGPVIEVRPEAGSAVRPGAFVARIAAEPLLVRIAVPERHLPFLRGAAAVRIETPEGPREAELIRVYPDVVQGRVEADLRLPDGIAPVPIGRRLPVSLQVDTAERLLVPRALVEQRHGLAFVRRADGGRTLVQLGRARGDRVTVLSGLRAGDLLVPP
jgi:RND family efflux transporter MFP subunit